MFWCVLILFWQNLKFVALPVPEIIAIGILGGVQTPIWGRGGRRGSEMVPLERALVSSYRPPIVTFSLSFPLRFSEILPLLCSSRPLFPTPPLVSQKFPHVPLGVGGWPLGHEGQSVRLSVRAISFQTRFPTYVILIQQRYRQTDRQTDRRLVRVLILCAIRQTELHNTDCIGSVAY